MNLKLFKKLPKKKTNKYYELIENVSTKFQVLKEFKKS